MILLNYFYYFVEKETNLIQKNKKTLKVKNGLTIQWQKCNLKHKRISTAKKLIKSSFLRNKKYIEEIPFRCLSYSLWFLYETICFSKLRRNTRQFLHSQGRRILFLLDKQHEFISTDRKKEIHEIGTETFDNHEYLWFKFVELLIA